MKYYTGTLRADGTLTNSRFAIDWWNLHMRTLNGVHRTNNVAESAHRRRQSLFSCKHPTLENSSRHYGRNKRIAMQIMHYT